MLLTFSVNSLMEEWFWEASASTAARRVASSALTVWTPRKLPPAKIRDAATRLDNFLLLIIKNPSKWK